MPTMLGKLRFDASPKSVRSFRSIIAQFGTKMPFQVVTLEK
jgi:hypothetical protein